MDLTIVKWVNRAEKICKSRQNIKKINMLFADFTLKKRKKLHLLHKGLHNEEKNHQQYLLHKLFCSGQKIYRL